jgi:hypothetical protein
MDAGAAPTPQQRIAAECARRGDAALIAGCVALLNGRSDEVDDSLITALGGEAAHYVLDGAAGGRSGYWPRVWAARGLLHAWNNHDRDNGHDHDRDNGHDRDHERGHERGHRDHTAGADTVTDAIIAAARDPAWRVREMAAKVVARHRVGAALGAVAALRDDSVPRVRAAASRAVLLLTATSS